MRHNLTILFLVLIQSCATVAHAQQARSLEPQLWVGGAWDHGGRQHAAAEVWFPRSSKDMQGQAWVGLGGIKPDGTCKVGFGYARMAGEDLGTYVFADVRAWTYFETSAGGSGGAGVDSGGGMVVGRAMVRLGYGYSGTGLHPRKLGLTGSIMMRWYPD
jgi:hypothetical protein